MSWKFFRKNRKTFALAALLSLALFGLLSLNGTLYGGTYTKDEYAQMQLIRAQQPGTAALTGRKSTVVSLRRFAPEAGASVPPAAAVCLSAEFFAALYIGGEKRLRDAALSPVSLFDRMDN